MINRAFNPKLRAIACKRLWLPLILVIALAPAASAATSRTVQLRVAQFNCDISDEYPRIPPSDVAAAIRRSHADVVGIEVSSWPVRPGVYSLYLLKDDLYHVTLARTTIRIVAGARPR